jgi:hypothetical protein
MPREQEIEEMSESEIDQQGDPAQMDERDEAATADQAFTMPVLVQGLGTQTPMPVPSSPGLIVQPTTERLTCFEKEGGEHDALHVCARHCGRRCCDQHAVSGKLRGADVLVCQFCVGSLDANKSEPPPPPGRAPQVLPQADLPSSSSSSSGSWLQPGLNAEAPAFVSNRPPVPVIIPVWTSQFFNGPGLSTQAAAASALLEPTDDNIITWGKHGGHTYRYILTKDPAYVRYCMRQRDPSASMQRFLGWVKKQG